MTVLNVVVSGAAGQIAYSLIPLIANGLVFGPDNRIELRLLDIEPAKEAMEGVKMEIQDGAYTLVNAVVPTSDLEVAFKDADVAILVGGFPRKAGMERKDLIEKNVTIFKAQGNAIEKYAKKTIKVLVVANPANTNCLIAMENAPSIPRKNFCAMTRLDHERLRAFLVARVNEELAKQGEASRVTSDDIDKCAIWGNHSSTQVPDVSFVEVTVDNIKVPLSKYVHDANYIEQKLVQDVQQRGAAIIKARKLSSAMSAANAAAAHIRNWLYGSKDSDYVSMSICSDGNSYGIPQGLIYSFPCKCLGNGEYEVINGLPISSRIATMQQASAKELVDEKAEAMEILSRYK